MKTIIEPFKIKSIEPIYFNTKEDRHIILEKAVKETTGLPIVIPTHQNRRTENIISKSK